MRKKYFKIVLMLLVSLLILSTATNTIGTVSKEFNNSNSEIITNQNDALEVRLEPAFLSRGVKLIFFNTGDSTLNNINWCFVTKPVITAILGKGDVCSQTIDELQAGQEMSIVLRPYLSAMPSPRGFGKVYMKLQAESDETFMVHDEKQAFLLLCVLFNMRDTYIDIQPERAYSMMMDEEFDLIIDVVGLDIYSLGHLPGAVNYVWADGTLEAEIPNLDKNGTYLVYCHTDPPSTDSAQALVEAGIESVYRLEGNYRSWVEAGYPVET